MPNENHVKWLIDPNMKNAFWLFECRICAENDWVMNGYGSGYHPF